MTPKLIDTYTKILSFASMQPDADNYINSVLDGEPSPVLVNGKRLAMPTELHLRNPSDEKIIFHPLCEDLIRGIGPTTERLRHAINVKLNFSIAVLAQYILMVAASPEMQVGLSPKQTQALSDLSEADDECLKHFNQIVIASAKANQDRAFVNIFLKSGGEVKGVKARRSGNVVFPILRELGNEKPYGIKIRPKDFQIFRNLMKAIFPFIEKEGAYTECSSSNVAPFIEALMAAAKGLALAINELTLEFKDQISDYESIMFDMGFVDVFKDLSLITNDIRSVPPQEGNIGKSPTDIAQQASGINPTAMSPTVPNKEITLPWNTGTQQPTQQQVLQQQVQQPVVQPQQQMPVVQQPMQPAQPQQTGPRTIDFNQLKQNQPWLNMMPNPLQNQIAESQLKALQAQGMTPEMMQYFMTVMQQQRASQNPVPGWAMQNQNINPNMMNHQQMQNLFQQFAQAMGGMQQPQQGMPMMGQPMVGQPMMGQPMMGQMPMGGMFQGRI